MNEISGQKPSKPLLQYDPNSRCWRMYQESFPQNEVISSGPYSGTWPKSGMIVSGLYYPHQILEPSKLEIGYGLLPTLPASESKDFASSDVLTKLDKGGRVARRICNISRTIHSNPTIVGLHPSFAEQIMGFPIGWTELKP